MKKRTWITLIIVVLVLAVGLVGFRFLMQDNQAEARTSGLQTETAIRGSLTATIGETGTVRARQSAVLVWNTSGSVEEVNTSVLDTVQKGEVLTTLDSASLSQNVLQAQSEKINAEEQLEDLYLNFEKNKAEAQLAVITAQEELQDLQKDRQWLNYPRCNQDTIEDYNDEYQRAIDRVSDLEDMYADFPDNANIRDALISARQTRDTAYANYTYCISDRTESELTEADTEIALAQAKLDLAQQTYEKYADGKPAAREIAALELRIEAAEATLAMAFIEASFDGTVTAVDVMPGDQVSAGTSAVRIDDLSQLLVDVEISEIDVNNIHTGQDVIFTFDAIPDREYNGSVVEIATVGSSVQGVVEFKVTTSIQDAGEEIRPGMTAIAEIVVEQLEDVLLVPNQAVRIVDGQRIVYVLAKDGTVKEVVVELGAQSLYNSQVTGGGLKAGDEIVLNPSDNIQDARPGESSGFRRMF